MGGSKKVNVDVHTNLRKAAGGYPHEHASLEAFHIPKGRSPEHLKICRDAHA